MKKRNILWDVWGILYPLGIYYVLIMIVMYIAGFAVGQGEETYVYRKLIGAVLTIPFLHQMFYVHDKTLNPGDYRKEPLKERAIGVAFAVAAGVFLGFGLNNLISLTPLMNSSEYADAASAQYATNLWLELGVFAVVTPLLEELLYRGIIFGRLRRLVKPWIAILISAAIFGAMHFNIVQLLYAGLIGIALAYLMDRAGHMYIAVACHMTVNALSIVRTETGFLSQTLVQKPWAYLLAVTACLVGVAILIAYGRRRGKEVA